MTGKIFGEKKTSSFETPILFLIYNRPEVTQIVFQRIKEIKPKYLYVAADGPKNKEEDLERCEKARNIVQYNIDWECDLKILFRESNLGCGKAVSEAITWFFDEVEMGIVLEDDTLPDLSFFGYCEEMLEVYKNDQRIMMVSGFNINGEWKSKVQSYHFSYFGGVWGWATWKRAWKLYDFNIKMWADDEIKNNLLKNFFKGYEKERKDLYDRLFRGEIDTWDYQWTFSKLINFGLSVIPSKNLIKNIGFGQSATHSKDKPAWLPEIWSKVELPLKFRNHLITDSEYDLLHMRLTSGEVKNSLITRLFRYLK